MPSLNLLSLVVNTSNKDLKKKKEKEMKPLKCEVYDGIKMHYVDVRAYGLLV
jgi:hypothetical protein